MALDQDTDVKVDAATTPVTEDAQAVLVGDQVGEGGGHKQSVCGRCLVVILQKPDHCEWLQKCPRR